MEAVVFRFTKDKSPWFLVFVVLVYVAQESTGQQGSSGRRQHSGSRHPTEGTRMCSEVRGILESKIKDSPSYAGDTGRHQHRQPHVCHQGASICCTPSLEIQMLEGSRTRVAKMMSDKMKNLKQTFFTWTAKFDTFFRTLIDRSKRNLHDMFIRSYGQFFSQNSQLFIQLFADLTDHFRSEAHSIDNTMDRFFSSLFQRMFILQNDDYDIDKGYMSCATEHMDRLRPFDGIPIQLTSQIKRSFLVARTFVKGLSEGKLSTIAIAKRSPDEECLRGMTQMLLCPYCQGLTSATPCHNYCLATASKCLNLQTELQADWNAYLDALSRVSERLYGSFSIESVVSLLDEKISEAIMQFHVNAVNITSGVTQLCGQPSIKSRQRRDSDIEEALSGSETFLSSNYSSLDLSSLTSSSSSAIDETTLRPEQIETTQDEQQLVQLEEQLEEQQEQEEKQEEQQEQLEEQLEEQQDNEYEMQQQYQKRRQRESDNDETRQQSKEQRRRQRQRGQRNETATQQPEAEEPEIRLQPEPTEEVEELSEGEEQEQEYDEQENRGDDQEEQRRRRPISRQHGQPRQPHGSRRRPVATEEPLTPLQELVVEVRAKIEAAREQWSKLRQAFCHDVTTESSNHTACWNGIELTSSHVPTDDGTGGGGTASADLTALTEQERFRLRNIVNKLRHACQWQDETSDTEGDGSGYEFGSGAEANDRRRPDPDVLHPKPSTGPATPKSQQSSNSAQSQNGATLSTLSSLSSKTILGVMTISVIARLCTALPYSCSLVFH